MSTSSDEFKSLFQPFGSIEHAVILAVLDNFSRRRGFVVFSAHSQARAAMRATHKTTVKSVLYLSSWTATYSFAEAINSMCRGPLSNALQAF